MSRRNCLPFVLIPVLGGSLSYLYAQLNREAPPHLSYTSSECGPDTFLTCRGRPPPAAPEACRKVGLLSLRSSTATCTVPVALRGGLPPSCTCTRSWKLLCCSRSRVWSVVTSPGSEDGDCDGMFKDSEPGNYRLVAGECGQVPGPNSSLNPHAYSQDLGWRSYLGICQSGDEVVRSQCLPVWGWMRKALLSSDSCRRL